MKRIGIPLMVLGATMGVVLTVFFARSSRQRGPTLGQPGRGMIHAVIDGRGNAESGAGGGSRVGAEEDYEREVDQRLARTQAHVEEDRRYTPERIMEIERVGGEHRRLAAEAAWAEMGLSQEDRSALRKIMAECQAERLRHKEQMVLEHRIPAGPTLGEMQDACERRKKEVLGEQRFKELNRRIFTILMRRQAEAAAARRARRDGSTP
jgi:hypothetical protein